MPLKAIFAELADYARYHFHEEERLMKANGIDHRRRDSHHRHHAEFVDQITAMWAARRAIRDLVETLHGLLCAWLAFHIQNRELATTDRLLEQRVAERTQKLAHANQELTELNRRLDALSNLDGLLQIANRRQFDKSLDSEWRRCCAGCRSRYRQHRSGHADSGEGSWARSSGRRRRLRTLPGQGRRSRPCAAGQVGKPALTSPGLPSGGD